MSNQALQRTRSRSVIIPSRAFYPRALLVASRLGVHLSFVVRLTLNQSNIVSLSELAKAKARAIRLSKKLNILIVSLPTTLLTPSFRLQTTGN